jgi:hypothetical protein
MGATRLLMRRLRDVLRLKYEAGLPHRAIALACAVGLGTVSSVLTRAALDDAALEARLFARPAAPSWCPPSSICSPSTIGCSRR